MPECRSNQVGHASYPFQRSAKVGLLITTLHSGVKCSFPIPNILTEVVTCERGGRS